MNNQLKQEIETFTGKKITAASPLSGGCINNAMKVIYEDGSMHLLKENSGAPADMFKKEAHALEELSKAEAIKVPRVIHFAEDYILTEYIEKAERRKDFYEDFGRRFARLHKYTSEQYGFYEDNYIGSTVQVNSYRKNWKDFFLENRIIFQYKLAEKNGYAKGELRSLFPKFLNEAEKMLDEVNEPASLLHGDLWSGNYMTDETGSACLIDPAVYYGHREADLAMTRVFETFDSRFYAAYSEEYPLDEGYAERENLYKLYHLLNHLNIFGTGYYSRCVAVIKS
ncbi:MAG: fructosamine kinase family protein [Methanococcaceae archaeon]